MGVLLTYVSEAIKVLTTLVYTPLLLELLGDSEYGLYQTVSSTVAYLSLLSLGFGSAYVRYHSKYYVVDDQKGIARLNGMFMLVFCAMSLVCLICGGVMIANARAVFGEKLTAGELEQSKLLMGILIISMAITFPNSVFNCFVTAHERFVFQKLLIVVQNLLNPCLTIPLLMLGYGSVAVVAVSAVLTAVVFVWNLCFCLKKLQMKFIFRGMEFALLKEMSAFTFFIFLNQIIDQVNWAVDKFLLVRLIGPAIVAVYSVGGQINSLYIQMSTAVSSVFIPKVNQIVAKSDDNHALTDLMTKVGRIQYIILGLVLVGFAFLGKPFIRLWAGGGYGEAYAVALLLMAPVTVSLVQNLGIEIQRAKNKHRVRSVVYACLAAGNVALSILLIPKWGCVGAAAGTAISLVVGNILFMNWYYHFKIGLNMVYFWKEILKFLPATAVTCLFGAVYVRFVPIGGWVMLLLSAGAFAAVYGAAMWLMGLNDYEKQLVKKMLRKLPGVK